MNDRELRGVPVTHTCSRGNKRIGGALIKFLIAAGSVNKRCVMSTGVNWALFLPLASEAVCVSGALIPNAASG